MTSKRKQIMQAIAAGAYLIDDMLHLGMPRKNLVDNIKACCLEKLLARESDIVTGQPGYKLTKEGRHWLETGETPRQQEAKQANPNTTTQAGSGEITPAAAHRATSLVTPNTGEGAAVNEPPQPDAKPVAVRSNECEMPTDKACCNAAKVVAKTAGGMVGELQKRCTEHEETIVELRGMLKNSEGSLESILSACRSFCGIASKHLLPEGNKYPLNLHECSIELGRYIGLLKAEASTLKAENTTLKALNEQIAAPIQNAPVATDRFIVTDSYFIAKTEDEANRIAMNLAQEIEIDTPVIVFAPTKARELRINWRDA